jgi:TfoX/Sxy family transcriptional regulator of competence genes
MPYSQTLFERLHDLMPRAPYKRMFGGVCLFINGHIVAGVFGDGMLVRLEPPRHADLIGQPGIRPLASKPNRMRGFVVIDEALLDDDEVMLEWLDQARAFVDTL